MNRYRREQEVFDKVYSNALKNGVGLISSEEEVRRYRHPSRLPIYPKVFSFYLLGDVRDKKVLDCGCGDGDNAIFLAKKGARVVAIDISQEGVNLTRAKAKINGVDDRVEVRQMSAEETNFSDNEFDYVLGNAILHHLDIDRAKKEVYRILKDGGCAIFREPVIFDKALDIVRKAIPYRQPNLTEDERPLSRADIESFSGGFSCAEWWPFEAISRIHFLFKDRHIVKFLFKLDYFLFKKIPFMERFSSSAVIWCVK